MSASTERKLRQAARAAGTDKKMLAAQEAAQKKKKSQIRWTLGTIAVVLLIALIFFLDSGVLYTRTTALTVGDKNYSPAEVSYYYGNEYHTMVNQYGSYISLFGLDTRSGISGLDKQDCPMLENGTWRDYFLQSAEENIKQVKALTDYAKQNGISLSEDEIAAIDAEIAQLADYAKTAGYASADNLLAANYGNGVTTSVVRQAYLDSALASKVYSEIYNGLSYTADELEAEYQSYNGEQDLFGFMFYYIAAVVEEGEEAPSDVAKVEAHADADAVYMAYADGTDIEDVEERFAVAVDSQFEGQTPTTRSGVAGSSLSAVYKEWLMDTERKAGDAAVFDDESGSWVVVFLSRDDNHYATANIRHILVKAEASEDGTYSDEAKAAAKARAEELLAEFQAGDKSEESFATMANLYSEDSGSNTNGGLYENVARGQMVKEFDAFLFEGHKPGDTGIVYGESSGYAGYHVMYYVGEGKQYSDMLAENSLRSSAMQSWVEEATAPYEVTVGSALRRVG
ncbi:MAG: peptidylprolyl isomerase [Oscillospiraceae bacterium]|nr:peptidylprolyl isomerase [Oscillospiraceae bacterium]